MSSIPDPLRAHRWIIREIAGMGLEDPADTTALLYAESVDLPKRVKGKWTSAKLQFYVVPENVEFLHLLSTLDSGSIRIDAVTPKHPHEPGKSYTVEEAQELELRRSVAIWWLDNCRFDHFEWDTLDYKSSELLMARLTVKPVEVRVTRPNRDIPPPAPESNVSNESGG